VRCSHILLCWIALAVLTQFLASWQLKHGHEWDSCSEGLPALPQFGKEVGDLPQTKKNALRGWQVEQPTREAPEHRDL
jgi:hypothetical protein